MRFFIFTYAECQNCQNCQNPLFDLRFGIDRRYGLSAEGDLTAQAEELSLPHEITGIIHTNAGPDRLLAVITEFLGLDSVPTFSMW